MLDRLDDIPWKRLTHAYGPAEDVPDLLRSLRTAPAEMTGEQSPLWHLFGNIWHQGTVYEATAYAVPFLIELAAQPLVPDRLGILGLLAAIATGTSFRDVHGNLLNEPDFAERKAVEIKWVEQAHAAVASGAAAFLAMTREETDVRLAAAHVLALLPEHREVVGARLRSMVDKETGSLQRAGLLLLVGLAGDRSEAALSVLTGALSGDDLVQRRAAAVAFAYLKPDPLPDLARTAILDAIAADDLENSFNGLPWDVVAEVMDRERLHACLDAASREEAAWSPSWPSSPATQRIKPFLPSLTSSSRSARRVTSRPSPAPTSLRCSGAPSAPWHPRWRVGGGYSTDCFGCGACPRRRRAYAHLHPMTGPYPTDNLS